MRKYLLVVLILSLMLFLASGVVFASKIAILPTGDINDDSINPDCQNAIKEINAIEGIKLINNNVKSKLVSVGVEVVPEDVVAKNIDGLGIGQEQLPTPKKLKALVKNLGVDYLIYIHSDTIWSIQNSSTDITLDMDIGIYDTVTDTTQIVTGEIKDRKTLLNEDKDYIEYVKKIIPILENAMYQDEQNNKYMNWGKLGLYDANKLRIQ